MRALILLESLIVLALAAAILFHTSSPSSAGQGERFLASSLLMDAMPGESVLYAADDGTSLEFTIGPVNREGKRGPVFSITRTFRDALRNTPEGGIVSYAHVLAEHGFFPLMSPEAPGDVDRVWILRRIARDDLSIRNRTIRCWRLELFDPALPADSDLVQAWYEEKVPVFGLVQWQRGKRKWTLESSTPAWKPAS
jgi:hypothetical protein